METQTGIIISLHNDRNYGVGVVFFKLTFFLSGGNDLGGSYFFWSSNCKKQWRGF